ncbi:ShlB/FhaC/HecB family hemolysin secretion/activation protein [Zavarzinia sp. CC-PAN008]|uniref:ShlB/FhaC/HecB family hemolysin secretion/activation protein n=1 Tax=Zavarzinia sp. CC-PAN008 TaxID=3243332 RepID=UPI003F747E80
MPKRRAVRAMLMALAVLAPGMALGILLPEPARAQAVPDGFVPPPNPVPQVAPPAPPPTVIEPIVIPTTRPGPPIGSENLRFVLGGLVLDGVTAIPQEDLQALWAGDLGKEIVLSRVFQIAGEVQALYRGRGFILTRALVPEQRAEGGIFRIRVIEGFVETVSIEGDIGPVRDLVERTMANVREERPVRLETLERYLLLVNDIPGIFATSTLRPSQTAQGGSELVVDVTHIPFAGYASVSNRGSRFTGPWGAAASAEIDSLTAYGERVGLLAFSTFSDEQRYVQMFGSAILNGEGLTLSAEASYGPSQPGLNLRTIDTVSESWFYALRVTDPIIRTRRLSLSLQGALDWTDEGVENAFFRQTRDQIRAVRAGVDFEVVDDWGGRNVGSVTASRGLRIFQTEDSSRLRSRSRGETDFTKFTFDVSRFQTIHQFTDDLRLTGLLRVGGQYAIDSLLSSEQFRLGNTLFGRGYAPSELSGDDGIGTTAELQLNGSADWTYAEKTQTLNWQLYGFYDFGAVWLREGDNIRRRTLAGSGAGVRLYHPEGLSLEVEVAKPLTRQPDEQFRAADRLGRGGRQDSDPVFYMRLSTVF